MINSHHLKCDSDTKGMLKHLRYGFAPNQLHFCGPQDSVAILDYAKKEEANLELRKLLSDFSGALPYLKYIAKANGIIDPFDYRVVEAYWVGNILLNNCDLKQFYIDLKERWRKKLSPQKLDLILQGVKAGARPHHSYHVLGVFQWTGGNEKYFKPTLKMVNNCLVRAGKVVAFDKSKNKYKVKTKELVYQKNSLGWKQGVVDYFDAFDSMKLSKGDLVSMHWRWICEKINLKSFQQIEYWTNYHLNL